MKNNNNIFVTVMHKAWGKSPHTYVLTATTDYDEAERAAEAECIDRAGKYIAEILKFKNGIATDSYGVAFCQKKD